MKKIYLNEIEEKSTELVNFSKNDIKERIDVLKDIPNKITWKGLAREKYIVGFNQKINKLNELNNNMSKIAEFLLRVKEDYTGANEKINNAYEELLAEFNIKGDNYFGM